MASEYMALNAIPAKGIGEQYYNGYEQGQRIAANNYANTVRQTQAQSTEDARQAQILIRAMQLGLDSPEEWDNAMQSAAKAGSRDASNFIGQWNPVRSEQLLHSYMNAYGLSTPGTPAAQRSIGAAATDGPQAAESPEYGEGTVQAIARMAPEERRKKVMQYDHAVNAMSHVNNEADLVAMVEDLKARGILDENAAQHYSQMFSDPVSKWRNFRAVRKQITGLRDHLAEYTGPQELGITPVGPEPTYKTEWDSENGIGVTTTIAPGKAPSFSVSRPIGGGGGQTGIGAPPKGMKDRFEMESQTRRSWSSDIQPLLTQKQAIDGIMNLDPGKTNGVEELSAIYNMVKALDPTSVVREGEIDLLNQAQSLVGRLKTLAGKAQAGHLITPAILTQMKEAAGKLQGIAKKTYDWRRKKMIQSIEPYQPYVNPESAVPDFWQTDQLPAPPGGGDDEIHEQEGRF